MAHLESTVRASTHEPSYSHEKTSSPMSRCTYFQREIPAQNAVTMQPQSRHLHRNRSHAKTLILVAERNTSTHSIANAIASRMRAAGQSVDISDATSGVQPPADDYDAVILGAEATAHRDRRLLGEYIARHRARLQAIPTGLFLLCSSDRRDPQRFVDAFETRVGMRATFAALFSYGRLRPVSGVFRGLLAAVLRYIDGSVADRGVKELTALADAMTNALTKSRTP